MLTPGKILQNRYRILRPIGQGGMGAVYLASDERLGSQVALKETLFIEETLRKAFEREAKLLANLHHAALPKVIDHFTEGKGQFLVMGFIPGEDLFEMLKRQRYAFPVKQVLGWADQLLDALDYIHTQNPPVIHRDIKPQNLKQTQRGQIVLLDFGLAKSFSGSITTAVANKSILGYTPNYAPLEQIQGTGTNSLSDLYSLAGTLYHLLTGTAPPDALTRATEVLSGRSDPLRLASEVNPQVPTTVAKVLNKAMALNPAARPQTAERMRQLLLDASSGNEAKSERDRSSNGYTDDRSQINQSFSNVLPTILPTPSEPEAERTLLAQPMLHHNQSEQTNSASFEHPNSSQRSQWLIFGVVLLVVAVSGAIWWTSSNSTTRSGAAVNSPARLSTLRGDLLQEFKTERDLYEVAMSADGQTLASISDENRIRLWRTSDRTQIRELTAGDYLNPGRCVAISADGKLIAMGGDDGKIRLWQASDGKLLFSQQAHADYVFMIAFSPDGQTLISASADKAIRLWRVKDGGMSGQIKLPRPDDLIITISSDQQIVATYGADQGVRLWSIPDNKFLRLLVGHKYEVSSGAFSSDRQFLALGSKDGSLRLWRVVDGNLLMTLKGQKGQVGSAAFSSDGKVIAGGWSDGSIRLWQLNGGELLTTLEDSKKMVQSLMFSADGRLLVSGSDDKVIRLWQLTGS